MPTHSSSFLGELWDSFKETGEQNEGASLPSRPTLGQEDGSSSSISPESIHQELRERLIMENIEMRIRICDLLREDFDKAEREFPLLADGLAFLEPKP